MKNTSKILGIVFGIFIGTFFVLNLFTVDRDFSEKENRILASSPTLTIKNVLSGDFQKKFEKYISDQFVFRNHFVSVKAIGERIVGKKENNNIYFGNDNTLLERFYEPDKKKVETNASYVESFASNIDVPVYFTLIPSSSEIWRYKLPQNAPTADEKGIIEYIKSNIIKTKYIDCYDILNRKSYEDIYYRTDHHWTSLGAYYAYIDLAKQMDIEPVLIETFNRQIVSKDFLGTYYSAVGYPFIEPDTIETFIDNNCEVEIYGDGNMVDGKLYDDSFLSKKDKYSFFMGGNHPIVKIRTGNRGKKLLVLRDSYADSQVPFWTNHYSEIHMLDLRYMKDSVSDYAKQTEIDEILIMYSVKNFSTDTNLLFLK